MKNKRFKKFLSMLLACLLVFNMLPAVAFATEPEYVYLTASYNGQFLEDQNGDPVAYVKASIDELSKIDLTEYGMSEYLYDGDGDGNYDITALHLFIYIHEEVCGLTWDSVTYGGSPGSIYFGDGLFGYNGENLRYNLNAEYPVDEVLSQKWGYLVGATADHIVLGDGDFLDVASFSCWGFYSEPLTGFHHFTDQLGNITHNYSVAEGNELSFNLVRAYSDWAGAGVDNEPNYTVYYGSQLGVAEGSVVTDEDGTASITLPEDGTWYIWCDGGIGTDGMGYHDNCEQYLYTGIPCIVSSPGSAIVTVEATANPDQDAADLVDDEINKIGEVALKSESVIKAARDAYESLTDTQKALVKNYQVLCDAEATLESLKTQDNLDKEAAKDVDALIEDIKTVTVFSDVKVSKARDAYDALTETQKGYVTKTQVLLDSEEELLELYNEASKVDYKELYTVTAKYLQGLGTPIVGSTGGEWMVIDLTRTGYDCPEGYYENVEKFVKEEINDKEQLHRSKSTENSRVILALTSAGYDVTDVAGHNLLMGLTDMRYLKTQGINGPIWALIAFDSHYYEIPTNPDAYDQVTREKIINYILESQLDNGGWALSGRGYDSDITGMAIQALAPYYDTNEEVKAAVDEALDMLSEIQSDNGGFSGVQDGTSSESCVQVAVALTSLGIDPEKDARFIKNGMSVIDAICLYAVDGGGFAHIPFGGVNGMATEQCQYALVAYNRLLNEQTSLYDMSDVQIRKVEKLPTVDATKPVDKVEVGTTEATKDVLEETSKEILDAVAKDPTKVTNVDKAVVEAIKNANDAGKKVVVSTAVKVETIDAKDAEKEFGKTHVALVEEAADKATIAQYLDLSVLMTVQADGTKVAEGEVSKLEKPITFTIAIPETLKKVADGMTRNYFVIRVHGDEVTKIPAKVNADGTLSFETDVFSTYALAYEDVAKTENPKTGDAGIMPWLVLMAIATACTAVLRRKEN